MAVGVGLSLGFLFCTYFIGLYFCCGCVCEYHTLLITIAFSYSLKSGSLIPPALFFFLKIALAIWALLCLHTNCKFYCSSSAKITVGNLMGIAEWPS